MNNEIVELGSIDGVKIYYNPLGKENEMLKVYKGPDYVTGYVYIPYNSTIETNEIKTNKEHSNDNDACSFIFGPTPHLELIKKLIKELNDKETE